MNRALMLFFVFLSVLSGSVFSQDAYVIRGARIHTVSGPVIEKGDVVIEKGIITQVGTVTPPQGAAVIEAQGLTVYPGIFDPHAMTGMNEAARESQFGPLMPEMTAYSSFRAHSERLPVIRAFGVTHVLARPRGGLIPGQGFLVHLDGWTAGQMEIQRHGPMIFDFPSVGPLEFTTDERYEVVPYSAAKPRYDRQVDSIRKLLAAAREYVKSPPAARNVRLESLIPVIRGEQTVLLAAENYADIHNAVEFAQKEKLNFVLLAGGDAGKAAGFLKDNKVRVILGPLQAPPDGEDVSVESVYRTPALFHQKGIPFALSSLGPGRSVGFEPRDLPTQAGVAVAYGLPYEAALRSVTLAPAEFYGVAGQLGSIEKGKKANLVVADGDLFELQTRCKYVFIQGRPVSLETIHSRQYEIYRQRP